MEIKCFYSNCRLCITFGRSGRHALPTGPHQSVSAATPRLPLVARSRRAASPTEVKRPRPIVVNGNINLRAHLFP